MQILEKIQHILDFWFGTIDHQGKVSAEKAKSWWLKSDHFDQEIKQLFDEDIQAAIRGQYDDWKTSAQGCLALIILLDQFSRNSYRDTPNAFQQDAQALQLTLYALDQGYDKTLPYIQRVFVYMPLQHSEDLAQQNRSIELYQALAATVPEVLREEYASFLDFAKQHQQIIARFQRFPHRNKILGRESTPEEILFLQQPGSSF